MFISLDQYYNGRDKQFSSELTEELRQNAKTLLNVVSALLAELDWKEYVVVSSGWRPQAINSKTKNAAKKSYHTLCLAIDVADKDGRLNKAILARPDLLEKYKLWMEDGKSTVGWTHLDLGTRPPRKIRVFKP